MRLVCLLGFLVSCKFTHGALPGDGSTVAMVDAAATDGNGNPDASGTGLDAAPGVACYGLGVWRVCLGSTPIGSFTLPPSIDTDASSLCLAAQPTGWTGGGQPPSCFIVRDTITVTATSVSGTRPLVLVAHADINIGLLDVASHIGGSTGPAAQSSACKMFQRTPTAMGGDGNGGGAGASFMTAGGNGGAGNGTEALGGLASTADAAAPTLLRGGCRGQPGAGGSGPVGQGGGAVFLLAGAKITITTRINASGAGGTGGSGAKSGGSGGGSGGMIVLYAPSIIGTGVVMANGGGAASGGSANGNSSSGADPTAAGIQATGGSGGGVGGAGGAGYANGADATSGSNNDGGGGGGGGGAGYLRSNIAPLGVVSPPVDVIP